METHSPIATRVDSQIALRTEDVPERMRWSIAQRFTLKNPDVQKRERLGLSLGHIQQRVPFYSNTVGPMGEEIVLPRGTFLRVSAIAMREGYSLDINGRNKVVTRSQKRLSYDDFGVVLRPYQKEAIGEMLNRVQGFVSLPCGAGKTVLGAAAIALTGEPGVVLVHTEDLAAQWTEVLSSMYGMTVRTVGAGGGDVRWLPLKAGEVAVAMVQTLHANPHKRARLLGSAGVALMDECHHAPADSFRNLFKLIPARYRWGLTATPERPDGWGPLLSMFIGPKLFEMTPAELVDSGYLEMPTILPVSSGVSAPDAVWSRNKISPAAATKAMTWLCKNGERTKLIVDLVMEAVEAGRTSLVLVPRVRFAKQIAEMLRQRGADACAVTGQMNKKTRERSLNDLRSGRLQVVVATQLADEGLDVPNLDFLLNASAGRSAGRAIQRVGRAMRIAPNKSSPVVVEIVDRGGVFERQWQARAFAYEAKLNTPIPVVVVADEAVETLQKMLDSKGAKK